jgi:hypothetical protein
MTDIWAIIKPKAKTNACTNPSVESAITGYSAVSTATLTRSSDKAKYGAWSAKVVCTGDSQGVDTPSYSTTGTKYLSAWVWVATGETVQCYTRKDGANTLVTTLTGDNSWQEVQAAPSGIATSILWRFLSNSGAQIFYVDGVQYEPNEYTTFLDGSLGDGYVWTGVEHLSTSSRSAQVRTGGQVIDFSTLGLTVISHLGTGMAKISNQTQKAVGMDGAGYAGYTVEPRSFVLTSTLVGTSLSNLHSLRQEIINTIKPDLTGQAQPFLLRYTSDDLSGAVEIQCVYDDGMDWKGAPGNGETIPLRMLAADPYWYGLGNESAALTVSQSVANADYILRNVDGVWSAMAGLTGAVYALAIGPDGTIYAGGNFTNASGVAACDYIAKWTVGASAWTALGTGMNGIVYAIAVGPDGSVYAGGAFTLAGGVANTVRIAKWNGSAWSALGTGANAGNVSSIAVGLDGSVYAGGTFTLMSGVANTVRIAKWNGSAWTALGTGMSSNGVAALAIGLDGSVFAGGDYGLAGGVANTIQIAKWNGSAWSALGTGMNGLVSTLIVSRNGELYAGGNFSTAGGVSAVGLAVWNSSYWKPISNGCNGQVTSMAIDAAGILYAGGAFTYLSGISADGASMYNQYSWLPVDADLPSLGFGAVVYSIAQRGNVILLSYDTTGTAVTSYQNTITPTATAAINPKVKIICSAGSPVVNYLKNDTTGATIWINYTMQVGETLTIELDPLKLAATSSYYGDVTGRCILRGSNMANFELLPAENKVSFFVNGGTVEATMTWPVRHWSLDGVVL